MKKYNKENNNQKGFTLVEISMSIIILGIMFATAAPLYKRYQENQKIEQTNLSLIQASNAIGGFKSVYGRYPCPAPADAQPGDVDYGYEDCTATAPGVRTTPAAPARAATLTGLGANPNIVIGTVPFRTLSLQENEIFDGYKNRLTYAVTQSQTVDTTFDAALGGVSIIDRNNGSIITPPDSGHFVVVSHGQNDQGSYTYSGVQKGACGAALARDVENCNDDAVFRVSQIEQDFDDQAVYSSSIDVTPWQYGNTAANANDIYLRRGDRIIMGENNLITDPTLTAAATQTFEARSVSGDGIIRTDPDLDVMLNPVADTGAVIAQNLCDEAGADCFQPQIIGGPLEPTELPVTSFGPGSIMGTELGNSTTTGGMTCEPGFVMVGIEDGLPLCSETIDFSCPPGEYMAGFTATGTPRCSTIPPANCPVTTVTTTCGESKNLPAANSGDWRSVYSGQCYMLNNFNGAAADAAIASPSGYPAKFAALQTYIDSLNATPRSQVDCRVSRSAGNDLDSLVRDTYQCDNGNYNLGSIVTQERLRLPTSWPGNPRSTANPAEPAEIAGAAYSISADANNNQGDHDCWCREDYRITPIPCPDGTNPLPSAPPGGGTFSIQKHTCPQTQHHINDWVPEPWGATVGAGLCTCVPGPVAPDFQTCSSYFGVSASAVSGMVVHNYNNTCTAGLPVITPSGPPDTSGCTCPGPRPDDINTTACPAGDINNWNHPVTSTNYVNTAQVRTSEWFCPTGFGGNVASAAQAGRYNPPTIVNEPCVCNSSALSDELENCPVGQNGSGTVWETQQSCTAAGFVRTGTILSGPDCRACSWKKPPGAGTTFVGVGYGSPAGGTCACGSVPQSCKEPAGSGQTTVWDNCSCTED